MPETTVTKTTYTDPDGNDRDQYRTTIPKGLAESFNLAGKKLEWEVESGNTLKLRVVDDD